MKLPELAGGEEGLETRLALRRRQLASRQEESGEGNDGAGGQKSAAGPADPETRKPRRPRKDERAGEPGAETRVEEGDAPIPPGRHGMATASVSW